MSEKRILWVMAFAAKPDDVSSVPWTHTAEGKTDSCKLSYLPHMHAHTCAHVCMHTYTITLNKHNEARIFTKRIL